MKCVHCGVALVGAFGGGLFQHANNLQRCQSNAVPYGHMGHPAMPCPGTPDDPNPCKGYREDNCDHLSADSSNGDNRG